MASRERLKIGISACFFHADAKRPIFTGKTLQYVEQSVAHWVMSTGALAVMIPSPSGDTQKGDTSLDDYAAWLDALVLEGGSDVWPGSYGEEPLDESWHGDRVRDEYEQGLLAAFAARGKPVLGICRGLQLMNVAHGGTLLQDIDAQRPGEVRHRKPPLTMPSPPWIKASSAASSFRPVSRNGMKAKNKSLPTLRKWTARFFPTASRCRTITIPANRPGFTSRCMDARTTRPNPNSFTAFLADAEMASSMWDKSRLIALAASMARAGIGPAKRTSSRPSRP